MAEQMSVNELQMKLRGQQRVWKSTLNTKGEMKKLSTIPLVQQILVVEAQRIEPAVIDWINNDCAKMYRKRMREYFDQQDVDMLECIVGILLFIASYSYIQAPEKIDRHKNIKTIMNKILIGMDFDLAWRIIEVVVDSSQYFNQSVRRVVSNNKHKTQIRYVSELDQEITRRLAAESYKAFMPGPMLEAPLPWIKNETEEGVEVIGGYHSHQMDFVRAGHYQSDASLISQRVIDAVNYIQSIPWKINLEVMAQVQADLKHPVKGDYIKVEFPEVDPQIFDVDLNDKNLSLSKTERKLIEKQRNDYREASDLYNAQKLDYLSAVGKFRAVQFAIDIGKRHVGQVIYFPHSLDFRGRIYPLPAMLSPQGSDSVKAMLEYERGEVLTERGVQWMWAYYASLYGDDKMLFDARVKRGKELYYNKVDYKQADEPYQFLAHRLEIERWEVDPDNYEFKGRVHLDACNSGSQFTSAITADLNGCVNTNVIPDLDADGNCIRHDAYLLVAQEALNACEDRLEHLKALNALSKLEDEEKQEVRRLKFFIKLLKDNGRKICKRPVMVSNYGGTAGGRTEIIYDMFRELDVPRKWINKTVASKFSKIIGDAIEGTLRGGKAFEKYIHEMNNLIAKNHVAVKWSTEDGFPVSHQKMKMTGVRRVTCLLPNSRKTTRIEVRKFSKDKVNAAKMKSAIAPNYIHSLDAELLRRVALQMSKQGIRDSDWIHDSFGCLPNHVDQMLLITKNEFRKMMRKTPLKKLHEELIDQVDASDYDSIPERPSLQGFDARLGGLDCVMDSEWFFS